MNLTQLKQAVEDAIICAEDKEESTDEIPVTIQLNSNHGESIWSDTHVGLCYDGGIMADGCVLFAFLDEAFPEDPEGVTKAETLIDLQNQIKEVRRIAHSSYGRHRDAILEIIRLLSGKEVDL